MATVHALPARQVGPFLLLAAAAALLTALLHEVGHWAAGTLLGNEMTLSLNAARVVGAYRAPGHEAIVSAAGPLVTFAQAGVSYAIIRWRGDAALMPFLLTAAVYRGMAAVMNVVNPNDEGRLSVLVGLDMWVLPTVVTVLLLALVVDAGRRTGYRPVQGGIGAVVAVHLLGLLVLADQYWSIRLL